jgi:formate hydrogenlyase subunit 4
MTLRDVILQIAQVLVVLFFASLLQGIIVQFEERVQRGQGPGIFQPYRDLWKLFHKEIVVPETASWLYWTAPIVAFTAMLTVPILIPVLTNYPLPLSDMGDILGGGLILTLGSFMVTLAGLDTTSAYGGIGSSRAVMVAILAEPTLILVFVGITLLAKAMLPFVVNHLLVAHPAIYWSPTHLLLVAAFFVLLLVETDRLPIHSNTHIEVYMIEEGRILEYAGPLLALLRWASAMKQFILYTIFCNVLLLPWGLSYQGTAVGVVGSMIALLGKFLLVACAVVLVDTTQSRLRFYRYQEPLAASFLSRRPGDHRHTVGVTAHVGSASRASRRVTLQPDRDCQSSPGVCDARLPLAASLPVRIHRRVLADRNTVRCRRLLWRLPRALCNRYPDAGVSRLLAALLDFPNYSQTARPA